MEKLISSFLLIFFLLPTLAGAQEESTTFIKRYGEKGTTSRGVTIEQTADLGFIITGNTTDGDHGGEDVVLIKTDPKGNMVWRRTYGGKGDESGWAVRQCRDGGYVVSGFTNSFGGGGMDIYLIKTDAEGEVIWTKTLGGEGDEFGWDVRETKDGNYIIASQTNTSAIGEIDAYLVKVDREGNELWSNTYGGVKTDRVFSVQEQEDGGFLAAGITYSHDSNGPNDRDGYTVRTDAKGKQLWYRVFGEDKYDVVHDVASTDDGGHILTGYGESYAEGGGTDVYLIRCDEKGEIIWKRAYGEGSSERGIKGIETEDEGFIAIGFIEENSNLFLVKADRYGNKQWSRSIGEPATVEFGYTVRQTKDGGYILLGHTENQATNTSQVLLVKTDSSGKVNQEK